MVAGLLERYLIAVIKSNGDVLIHLTVCQYWCAGWLKYAQGECLASCFVVMHSPVQLVVDVLRGFEGGLIMDTNVSSMG